MATTTFHNHDGDGSDVTFTYSFPTIKKEDVKVRVSDVLVDNWHFDGGWAASGTRTIKFDNGDGNGDNSSGTVNSTVCESSGAPKTGTNNVYIYRDTEVDQADKRATYTAGAAVQATDLNNVYDHTLHSLQERQNQNILSDKIKDDAVTEAKLKVSNSPTDGYYLQYKDSTDKLTWAAVSGGGGGGGGSTTITVQDEGSALSTAATTLNFVGAGVTASGTGATKTITIAGGGGGSSASFTSLTLRNAANDGAAVLNGSQANFTLVTEGTTTAFTAAGGAHSLIVSVGGVVQKPNTGTGTPAEGYALDGSTIKFGANLSSAPNFIICQSTATSVGTPSNNVITEAQLNANAPTNDYVLTADSTVAAGFKWAAVAAGTALANEATDTTCFPVFATAATDAAWSTAKSNASLTFNSATAQFSSKLVHAEVFENPTALTANYSVTAGKNAHVAGPYSTGSYTLTVPSGTTFTII